MDRSAVDYSERRTSSRTRFAPERYGAPVTNADYIDYNNTMTLSRSTSSSHSQPHHTQTNRGSTLPQMTHVQQPNTMVNRVNMSGSSMINQVPGSNISRNNILRNMPVYPSYPANYINRNNNPTVRRNSDFPMVSMNSYEIVEVLVPLTLCPIHKGLKNDRIISRHIMYQYINNPNYKFFIRFCKIDNKKTAQLDCLPKCFLLTINGEALQIKTKYSGNPYEITRLLNDKNKDVVFRVEISDPIEHSMQYHYGIVVVKRVDLKYLITTLPKTPFDSLYTINIVKKLLEHDDDILMEGGEENNNVKVSLRCPYSSARLVNPARSKRCQHVACFDLQAFIEMNEVSSKWKCPHCREYIVVSDLIIDGLLTRILKDAPKNANEAFIDVMGRYTYDVSREPVVPAMTAIKRERVSPETVQPIKKVKMDVECITISDSDTDEEENSSTPSPPKNQTPQQRSESIENTNSALSPNNESSEDESSSDDDIEIIFEKIATPPRPARTRAADRIPPHPVSINNWLSSTSAALAGSSNNVAKPVAMHLNQTPKSPAPTSLLEMPVRSYGNSNININNNTEQNLPPNTRIVHNFYKNEHDSWQQKISVRPNNTMIPNPPIPHYGIYEGLPPERRPIFHPTYSNQPNIFQYSNHSMSPMGSNMYPFTNSAFRDPRPQYDDNSISYYTNGRNNGPEMSSSYSPDPAQSSSTNYHIPQRDMNPNS